MTVHVNYETMETLMNYLASAASDITTRLDTLESQLAPMRENWEGQAQEAYITAKVRWDGAMMEMTQLLEQARANVLASADSYRNADQQGKKLFNGLV